MKDEETDVLIHPEQKNVEALCAVAHFVDSGFQSFIEQVGGIPARKAPEAAFYAGAALSLKLIDYFKSTPYSRDETEYLISLIYVEVNEFMDANRMKLEWQPHVPRNWQS